MPRKTYPSPEQFATGSAFLPGKPPRSIEVAPTERHFGGSSAAVVWTDAVSDLEDRDLAVREGPPRSI